MTVTSAVLGVKVKVWFYIALYPVRWTAQSALHFPPLADLFIPTPFSASLGSILAMQQLRNDYSLTFPPLSIARYSCIQLSRLRRREVKEKMPKLRNGNNGDSNPGSGSIASPAFYQLSYRAPRLSRTHTASSIIVRYFRLAKSNNQFSCLPCMNTGITEHYNIRPTGLRQSSTNVTLW